MCLPRFPIDRGKRLLWPDLNSPGPNGEPRPVTAKEFAKTMHFDTSTVYDLIIKNRIYGVWVKHRKARWYVYPHTYRAPGQLVPARRD